MKINIALLTVTDTRTFDNDKSGAILVEKIKQSNHNLLDRKICKDNKDEIVIILKEWLQNEKLDVIITTGGASVGEEDHLINILKKIGKLFFWRASIKPGRPIAVGKINKTIIICLPGNPVSVHLLFGMIIYPFLKSLTGSNFILPQKILAKTNFS